METRRSQLALSSTHSHTHTVTHTVTHTRTHTHTHTHTRTKKSAWGTWGNDVPHGDNSESIQPPRSPVAGRTQREEKAMSTRTRINTHIHTHAHARAHRVGCGTSSCDRRTQHGTHRFTGAGLYAVARSFGLAALLAMATTCLPASNGAAAAMRVDEMDRPGVEDWSPFPDANRRVASSSSKMDRHSPPDRSTKDSACAATWLVLVEPKKNQ